MSNVLSLISDEEKKMILSYINNYAIPSSCGSKCCGVDYILREWACQKNSWLGNIFGDSLIHSEPVTYRTSDSELWEKIDREPEVTKFVRAWLKWSRSYAQFNFETESNLAALVSVSALMTNIYKGEKFQIADPSRPDKFIVIPSGCKTMKAIGKIYNVYSPHIAADFESFRIAVSQILNTATISGDLCISIHPLDYMTMSDNECDWDSCMSWKNEGSYRQGTVEMMNSRYVVVAYLTAKEDMSLCGYDWNNKKWRSLYIVSPSFIGNVKGYPYQLKDIDKVVINRLKEMVTKNDPSYTYGDIITYNYESDDNVDSHRLYLETGYMYNDFGSLEENFCCFNTNLEENEKVAINYSGASECMICGDLNIDIDQESSLVCRDCWEMDRCDECGEYDQYLIETGDGHWVCESCLNEYYTRSMADDEYYRTDDMVMVYVLPDMLRDHMDKVDLAHSYSLPCIYDNYDYELQDDYSRERFEKKYLVKNAHVNVDMPIRQWARKRYYIFRSDINDDWSDTFEDYTSYLCGSRYFNALKYYSSIRVTDEALESELETYVRKMAD